MQVRLTNSEMMTWLGCRRDWYLTVYRGLRRRNRPAAGRPTTTGNRYHDAMAGWYDPANPVHPVVTVEESVMRDVAMFPEQEEYVLKEGELVRIMVEGYVEWLEETGIDSDLRVLAAESKIEVPLLSYKGYDVTLLSKIDARVERISTGDRLALEHKTVQSLTQPLSILRGNHQLLTEQVVELKSLKASGEEEKRAVGVLYNMARKVKRTARAKPPFYGREYVYHNVQELRNHWVHCCAIAREIVDARIQLDAGASHHAVCPPHVSRDLTWKSEFFRDGIYPLMDDGSDWEAAVAALYEEGNYLERYEGVGEYEEEA